MDCQCNICRSARAAPKFYPLLLALVTDDEQGRARERPEYQETLRAARKALTDFEGAPT